MITNKIVFGDNLCFLKTLEDECIDLIYIDPPFNTNKIQEMKRIKAKTNEGGDRIGFGGKRYSVSQIGSMSFVDVFEDFLGFLNPRLCEAHRVLKPNGSLFFHIDYREVHYCKVMLDSIFGRENFMNEIIWSYDYGARSKTRWPCKHDTILWYAKNNKSYTFNFEQIDRIPYMSPGLVGEEKALRGKTLTDVWWNTIVPTNGKERTGYPTQKPIAILNRIIKVHSSIGDFVLDFFAGSGTTGEACATNNRNFILVDNNQDSIQIMTKRLSSVDYEYVQLEQQEYLSNNEHGMSKK